MKNVLLGEDGYVCLNDLSIARLKEESEEVGLHEYLSPEMIEKKNCSFSVDWWALGALTYQMLYGYTPFYTGISNNKKLYQLINTEPVTFPAQKKSGITISQECKDFISACLEKDPQKRLGVNGL